MTTVVTPAAPPTQVIPNVGADAGKGASADAAAAAAAKTAADSAAAQTAEKAKADAVLAEKAKADEASAAKVKADEAAAEKAKGAGAEVKYELKLQEGSLLTAERDVAEVIQLAKSKGFAPEVAQVLLDQRHTAVKTFVEGQDKAIGDLKGQWKAENAKRHGEKYAATEKEVQALVLKHGPAGLWERLNAFGLEPDVFQTLATIAAQGRDDKFVSGAAVTAGINEIKDPQQRLAARMRAEEAARTK